MRAIPAILFVFFLAFLVQGAAQDPGTSDSLVVPQPLLPNASQATSSSDPNDSGYTSLYLQQHDWTSEDDADDAMLRTEANLQRRGGNPSFAGDMMDQAQQQRVLFPQFLGVGPFAPGIPVWVSIGPTKSNHIQNGVLRTVVDSGRMRSILPHPTDPNVMYLLTSSGGLWKTTDFLMNKPHWTAKTDFLATTSGGAATFGRTPSTIHLGLGDPFDGNVAAGAYMLRTDDGGDTWSPAVRLNNASSIRDVKIDTSGGQDIVLVATNFGLFRSTDGGATFKRNSSAVFLYPTPIGTFSQTVWSIVNTSIGWVASTESPFAGFSTDGLGNLVISTDHGATWSSLASLQETFPQPKGGPVTVSAGRITLGVGAPGDSSVFAFTADQGDGSQLDLFRSVNGGAAWAPLGLPFKTPVNPNPDAPNMNIMGGQAFYNHMLLVDPNDANRNTVYIGGQLSSAKTVDGGNTWQILADWLALFKMPYVHADYHAAAISPVTNSIFFGTDGGLFVSNDAGASWDDGKNEGIVSTLAYSIATSPHSSAISIIGTQDNGTFTHVPNTTFWEQTLGGDGIGTAWSKANNNFDVAFTSFPGSNIVRSTNNPPLIQAKWSFARNGVNRKFGNFFTAYATPSAAGDPSGQAFFTYTSRQIYATTSAGSIWTDIGHTTIPGNPNAKPPIPDTPPSPGIGPTRIFRDTPHGIGVSPAADGLAHVAVVCNGGFVVVTHNGGASWMQTGLIGTVPGWGGFNSNAEWADDNTLYIASENPSPGGRVAKSTNGGASFTRADAGLPNVPISRLLVSPLDKNTIYAATFLGVYRTTDGGASWARFGASLPMVEVDDIYMPPDGSFLRIASFGRGVWEIQL